MHTVQNLLVPATHLYSDKALLDDLARVVHTYLLEKKHVACASELKDGPVSWGLARFVVDTGTVKQG